MLRGIVRGRMILNCFEGYKWNRDDNAAEGQLYRLMGGGAADGEQHSNPAALNSQSHHSHETKRASEKERGSER